MKRHNTVARAARAFREEDHAQPLIQRLVYLSDHPWDVLQLSAVDEDRADAASQQPYAGPIGDFASGNEDAPQTRRIGDNVDITQMVRDQKERGPRGVADRHYAHSYDRGQRPPPGAQQNPPPSPPELLERRDRILADQPEHVQRGRRQNHSRDSDYDSK